MDMPQLIEIKHIHETLGATVVSVALDQSEALTMSNRIAVFNKGINSSRRRKISTNGRTMPSSPSSLAKTT